MVWIFYFNFKEQFLKKELRKLSVKNEQKQKGKKTHLDINYLHVRCLFTRLRGRSFNYAPIQFHWGINISKFIRVSLGFIGISFGILGVSLSVFGYHRGINGVHGVSLGYHRGSLGYHLGSKGCSLGFIGVKRRTGKECIFMLCYGFVMDGLP